MSQASAVIDSEMPVLDPADPDRRDGGDRTSPIQVLAPARVGAPDRYCSFPALACLDNGDILLAFEGTPTSSPEDLLDLLADAQAGRQATLHVLRGDRSVDVQVTVGERPGR